MGEPQTPRSNKVRANRRQKRFIGYEPTVGYPDRTLERLMDPDIRRQLEEIRDRKPDRIEVVRFTETTEYEFRTSIRLPPCHRLAISAKWLLSEAAYRRYVEPHLMDIRSEYFEAIKAHRHAQARWIVLRGYWHVLAPLRRGIWVTLLRWVVRLGAGGS